MLEKDIRLNIKGKIVKGEDSPHGEILIEENEGHYYVYVWPNDGTKWPGTDDDMMYDSWYENQKILLINLRNTEVEWFTEEQQKADALKYAKYKLTDAEKEAERQRVTNFIARFERLSSQRRSGKSESE